MLEYLTMHEFEKTVKSLPPGVMYSKTRFIIYTGCNLIKNQSSDRKYCAIHYMNSFSSRVRNNVMFHKKRYINKKLCLRTKRPIIIVITICGKYQKLLTKSNKKLEHENATQVIFHYIYVRSL